MPRHENSPRRRAVSSARLRSPRTPTSSSWRSRRVEPAGPTHERISGKAYGELDPADPKNAVITDIDLAPAKRARQGRVHHHVHAREAEGDDEARAACCCTRW